MSAVMPVVTGLLPGASKFCLMLIKQNYEVPGIDAVTTGISALTCLFR
jgi:hypothetical protein